MNLYQVAKTVVYGALSPIYRFDVHGTEDFPKEGGVLVCSNHIHALDPPVVGILAPRPVHFMAKEELFNAPILKTLIPKLNAFPVKRGMSDREAMRKAIQLLKDGNVVGLFPEGTRSKDGVLKEGLAGAGFFALRGDAVVIPTAIVGPYKPFKRLKVIYGKPMDMTPFREQRASADVVTAAIMAEIQKLLDAHK
ncbi:lysophospholipid acyltransferase family protein [Chryseomicrobium aureum]|uniref:lysophospholipid acyltransferase family protein n=1 Tax=Chryseomicrobium aureum TaxID=1441723 RepID=UPI001956E462|nr:lysophospholipid acyltransferase family protein [Chryseomicrobium aureum]MBM7705504.1 1-acyl-sn-glycerol-3-phosphate acyltransferase [Chryseomicrobium aureum]